MSFWNDAADWVSDTATSAAEYVADGVETAGNLAQDALDEAAAAVENVPGVGGAAAAGLRWFGGVSSAVGDAFGAFVMGVGSFLSGVLGGGLRLVGAILKGDMGGIIRAIKEILSGIIGGILVYVGKLLSFVQTFFGIERKRKLTTDEICVLRLVFRDTVAAYDIRIVKGGAGVFSSNDRPFTLGNTIYMKDTSAVDWNHVLVHESTHVWQYQNVGSSYASDAVGAQMLLGQGKAYDWQSELQFPWEVFSKEAAAQMIEDIYEYGAYRDERATLVTEEGAFFNADGSRRIGVFVIPNANHKPPTSEGYTSGDYTSWANEAVTALRGAKNVRPSGQRLDKVRCTDD